MLRGRGERERGAMRFVVVKGLEEEGEMWYFF